jgi:hypothetical protein
MIEIKCTNNLCGYAATKEKAKTEKITKRKKCPLCKAQLKQNITDPIARKRWHCFLGQGKEIIEYAVLVIIDSYSDDSHEVGIPLLSMTFVEKDKLQAIYRASNAIKTFLETQHKTVFGNEQLFITTAYQHEVEALRQNVPLNKLIFVDSDRTSLKDSMSEQARSDETTDIQARRKKAN